MAAVPLTRESIRTLSNNVKRQLQVEKVQISKNFLNHLQYNDEFVPNKLITSYVTSTNAKNKYEDINRFWTAMEKAPKYWLKKFIYVSEVEGAGINERIYKAAVEAVDIAYRQYSSYPRYLNPKQKRKSPSLKENLKTEVNGERTFNISDILKSPGTAVFQMYNIAEYASTAESRAVFVTRQRGLIFYAANRIQTMYPDLGVRYYYMRQTEHKEAFKYDIPTLIISSKANARGNWHRPGYRLKERQRDTRRAEGLVRRFRENNLGE